MGVCVFYTVAMAEEKHELEFDDILGLDTLDQKEIKRLQKIEQDLLEEKTRFQKRIHSLENEVLVFTDTLVAVRISLQEQVILEYPIYSWEDEMAYLDPLPDKKNLHRSRCDWYSTKDKRNPLNYPPFIKNVKDKLETIGKSELIHTLFYNFYESGYSESSGMPWGSSFCHATIMGFMYIVTDRHVYRLYYSRAIIKEDKPEMETVPVSINDLSFCSVQQRTTDSIIRGGILVCDVVHSFTPKKDKTALFHFTRHNKGWLGVNTERMSCRTLTEQMSRSLHTFISMYSCF